MQSEPTVSAQIIDGNPISARIRDAVQHETKLLAQQGRRPCLAALLVGSDDGSRLYAAAQAETAHRVGIDHRLVEVPDGATSDDIREQIDELNLDPAVSGILVYQPLPRQVDAAAIQQMIDPRKDVEGVHPFNLGLLSMGRDALAPCTAAAAMECLASTGIDLAGREAVVIGRSAIVGRPVASLLVKAHATVTVCHTRTQQLEQHTRRADVLIVAAGKPGLIGAEHVRPGAIVIDVGTHRVRVSGEGSTAKTKTVGDVRFDEVAHVAAAITPVPGGVGPVTVAMLLSNVVKAAKAAERDAGR